MTRRTGTTSRGIRTPIIRSGDNLAEIIVDSVMVAAKDEEFALNDQDVIAVTESVVARAENNYATVDDIATDVKRLFPEGELGVIFPILSRNRFATNLRGIARGARKIVLQLSYPDDEVGNSLMDLDKMDEKGIDPLKDCLTQARYRELFGVNRHAFTGVDYVGLYQDIIADENCEAEIILANDPLAILRYTPYVLVCDVHTRQRTKRLLKRAGAKRVLGLDDILSQPVNGSGFHETYGLLGSNKASENIVKLFPRGGEAFVNTVSELFFNRTGKRVEVMIYGDGAFKDPVCKIWELADPVVSPAYTNGLKGTPRELKLKYLTDNEFADLTGEALQEAVMQAIAEKEHNQNFESNAEGTTPRQFTDLLGSLADLTSGSGDKGTPVVLIQGYFDSLAD
ncbi:MAG TPA: coenzyme F420-0:L-glutamate ligase [Clostridia bacterium]|nr:coenzyme F420-0:L-glutamate ligase [Clostridia bacterium]